MAEGRTLLNRPVSSVSRRNSRVTMVARCCAKRCRPEHVVLSGLLFGYHLASSAALLLRLLGGGGAADDDDAADDSRC